MFANAIKSSPLMLNERKAKLNKQKRALIFFLCLYLCCAAIVLLHPVAAANEQTAVDLGFDYDDYEANVELLKTKKGSLAGFVYQMLSTIYGVDPDMTLAGKIRDIVSLARFQCSNGTIWEVVMKPTYEAASVIGISLVTMYLLIELLDAMMSDKFTIEIFFRKLLYYAVAVIVIINGGDLLNGIINLSDAILNDYLEIGEGAKQTATLQQAWRDLYIGDWTSLSGVMDLLGYMISTVILWILQLIALLIIWLLGYARIIELMVRYMLAPIGMATLVQGGARSPGMKYLKKFASCCLRGTVILVTVCAGDILTSIIQMSAQTGSLTGGVNVLGLATVTNLVCLIPHILITLSVLGLILKADRIADEVVGV